MKETWQEQIVILLARVKKKKQSKFQDESGNTVSHSKIFLTSLTISL